MTLYLTQDEVKEVLDMKSTLEAVENGFREMGNEKQGKNIWKQSQGKHRRGERIFMTDGIG